MSDIYDLYQGIPARGNLPAEYVEKMSHPIPNTGVMDRAKFLVEAVKGRTVLDIGASGPMAELLQQAAGAYYGTDITLNEAIKNFFQIDLDQAVTLPLIPELDLVIAGEVIEHLSNAGHFLDLVHKYGVPVILTTPNAFSIAGIAHLRYGIENVNREHVAWYSYHTLKVLIERHNFRLISWYWYNGKPLIAEGLIFQMEPEFNGKD